MRIGVVVVMVLAVMAGGVQAADAPEQVAQRAADAWLKLADAGDGEATWEQAARPFKGAVTKEQWVQALKGVRGPLGRVVSRTVKSRQYTRTLPGAPDGEYVVIQYDTVFEHKAAAVETVTPMVDADGAWRVSGYYIR